MLKRAWIPLLLVAVLSVSTLAVTRLHRQFASQDLNANAGAGIEIVQFNPKIMMYEVTARPEHRPHQLLRRRREHAPDQRRGAAVVVHGVDDAAHRERQPHGADRRRIIGCRVTVNGELREHQSSDGINAQTFCLVKSA